ncbi:hypothetical protein B0I37DRAFT_354065 [Chaetomium sp. MPI-CAGE-AT-0009]|nr:hypothetical protein B0I37DRAFT_354065 [Chaetomium sp. MPI-CAGE-AT-0009]
MGSSGCDTVACFAFESEARGSFNFGSHHQTYPPQKSQRQRWQSQKSQIPPPAPSPLFSVDIELYIKVNPRFEALTREKQRTNPASLPPHWRDWDFDLEKTSENAITAERVKHQKRLDTALNAIFDSAFGPGSGWVCDWNKGTKAGWLVLPENPRKWWGVAILSPPMSASKHWQLEIEMLFKELGKKFDFWTDESCSCHVHVSPGPTTNNGYTLDRLVKVAKGAFFWDYALCDLIPYQRHMDDDCRPNHTVFASNEFNAVSRRGWEPVFRAIDEASMLRLAQPDFLTEMQGGNNRTRRYPLSTDFSQVEEMGIVTLRRQAGAASAMTTIHRVLLALTLHVSALRYTFDEAGSRTDYPRGAELIKELAGCIKKLPETCHGSRFVNFLKWSHQSHDGGKIFTEAQINAREDCLRNGLPPPNQRWTLSRQSGCLPAEALPLKQARAEPPLPRADVEAEQQAQAEGEELPLRRADVEAEQQAQAAAEAAPPLPRADGEEERQAEADGEEQQQAQAAAEAAPPAPAPLPRLEPPPPPPPAAAAEAAPAPLPPPPADRPPAVPRPEAARRVYPSAPRRHRRPGPRAARARRPLCALRFSAVGGRRVRVTLKL